MWYVDLSRVMQTTVVEVSPAWGGCAGGLPAVVVNRYTGLVGDRLMDCRQWNRFKVMEMLNSCVAK